MKNKCPQEYKTSAVKMVLEEGKNPTEFAHCWEFLWVCCTNGFGNIKVLIQKGK
jgi:hypothetical protein